MIEMQLSASKLDKKDFFGKSDPLFEISKAQESGAYTVVYRSNPILKTLDPRWPRFQITAQKLCSGDWDRTLKISVWDWNKEREYSIDLINPELKREKKKYKNSGSLIFSLVKATPVHSFMDYIKGGCQISLITAIDFTASNGKPHLPSSLHYNNPYQLGSLKDPEG